MKKKHSPVNNHRRRTLRIPLPVPPQWTEAKMADLEGSSRVRLIYNASHFNALQHGPVGLSKIVAVSGHQATAAKAAFGLRLLAEQSDIKERGQLTNRQSTVATTMWYQSAEGTRTTECSI